MEANIGCLALALCILGKVSKEKPDKKEKNPKKKDPTIRLYPTTEEAIRFFEYGTPFEGQTEEEIAQEFNDDDDLEGGDDDVY